MTRLFDGEVGVGHMQFSVETPDLLPGEEVERRYAGQDNGLCRAGEPGMLHCTTGLHTGSVPVAVDLLAAAPDDVDAGWSDTGWEEVVEVSLTTTTPSMLLYDWDHQEPVELPIGAGSFRVRYHATGMDAGRDADVRGEDEPVLDRYLLQFWPAPPAPDAVLRRTSRIAAYWHDTARTAPATDPVGTSTDDGEDELAAHRAAIDHVLDSGPHRQRAEARWLAHRAAAIAAEFGDVRFTEWVRPALDALDRGRPFPPPFDDPEDAVAALHRDLSPESSEVTWNPATATTCAVRVVLAAADPDPARAFLGAQTMTGLVHPPIGRELEAELRARFSQ